MHHQSTMKVGTDAVLLGAWVSVESALRILDAGTGSGILALMIAQRNSEAIIHAIDVDEASAEEAKTNFARSPWSNRLTACCADLRIYQPNQDVFFDLICSNPPFFDNHLKTQNTRRNLARHTDNLSYENLLESMSRLLSVNGIAAMVLPWSTGNQIMQIAPSFGLWPARIQHLIPVAGREPNRMNLELRKGQDFPAEESTFVIRSTDMQFTQEYYHLLKDFYLGFGK